MFMGTPENLMKQAGMTVHVYLMDAVRSIDGQFGDGYAAAHPELVAAFIQACAIDYATAIYFQKETPCHT